MQQPTLTSALYTEHDKLEVLKKYEQLLKETGESKNLQHANFLSQYRNTLTDKKYSGTLKKYFKSIEEGILEKQGCIEGRFKSVISVERKILKALSENKALDTIRDLVAFRIILFDEKDKQEEAIKLCYSIMNKIIQLGIEMGFILCEASPVDETFGFDNSQHNIFVPESSGILNEFSFGVKDYILSPKRNGYQSLHVAFRFPNGRCFEVQVRTQTMDAHAEFGDANHKDYKESEYDILEFDRSKIQIPGYVFYNEKVSDRIGLEKALLFSF